MNAISQRHSGAVFIPARVEAPALPPKVATFLQASEAYATARAKWQSLPPEAREDVFVGIPPTAVVLTDGEASEVARAEAHLAAQLNPILMAQFRLWLAPVNAAVRNPQSEEDFAVRCQGLFGMLDDLPAGAFTAEARKALPGFFPSAADIRQAVEPGARRLLSLIAGLRAAQRPVEPKGSDIPEARAERTPEEIAEVKAKVAAFMAERNAAGGPAEMPQVEPRYITGLALEKIRAECPLVKAARAQQARMAERAQA